MAIIEIDKRSLDTMLLAFRQCKRSNRFLTKIESDKALLSLEEVERLEAQLSAGSNAKGGSLTLENNSVEIIRSSSDSVVEVRVEVEEFDKYDQPLVRVYVNDNNVFANLAILGDE